MSKEINMRIAKYRRLNGYTQAQLADMLGLNCSTYSQCEREGTISADRLLQIAKILNVRPNVLLTGEEDESAEVIRESIRKQLLADQPELQRRSVTDDMRLTRQEKDHIVMLRNIGKVKRTYIMQWTFNEFKYKGKKTTPEPDDD